MSNPTTFASNEAQGIPFATRQDLHDYPQDRAWGFGSEQLTAGRGEGDGGGIPQWRVTSYATNAENQFQQIPNYEAQK